MLKIFLGNMGGVIYHPPTYFDNQYEDEWITDPLTKEMVKDVDQSEVISSRLIDSPVRVLIFFIYFAYTATIASRH